MKKIDLTVAIGFLLPCAWLPGAIAQEAPQPPATSDPVNGVINTSITEVINCIATATPEQVPWGLRFTYWLSGIAEFDAAGNMLPVAGTAHRDWKLTMTNSSVPAPETFPLTVLDPSVSNPGFQFPAVSFAEWEAIGARSSSQFVAAFAYPRATHGLYLAIRNTESRPNPRQLFQVIHFVDEDLALLSDVSVCFLGSHSPLPPLEELEDVP